MKCQKDVVKVVEKLGSLERQLGKKVSFITNAQKYYTKPNLSHTQI